MARDGCCHMIRALPAMLCGLVLLGAGPTTATKPERPLPGQPATATNASCRELEKGYRQRYQDRMAYATKLTSDANKNTKAGSKEWHEVYRQSSRTMDEAWTILTTGWREYGQCKAAVREGERRTAKGTPPREAQQSSPRPTTGSIDSASPDLHAAWADRERRRKGQEAEIMQRWDKTLRDVPEGDKREELLRQAEVELDRIHRGRAGDLEPKQLTRDQKPSTGELRPAADTSTPPRNEAPREADIRAAKQLLSGGFEAGAKSIERDLDQGRRNFSKKDWERFEPDARDTAHAIRAVGNLVRYSEYGKHLAEFVTADTPVKELDAVKDLSINLGKNVGTEYLKAAKPQIVSTVAKFFGQRAALIVEGLAGWPVLVGAELLSSENTGRDAREIIQDNSGRASLADKQQALRDLWRMYDKHGSSWGEAQKRELLFFSGQIYQQAGDERGPQIRKP